MEPTVEPRFLDALLDVLDHPFNMVLLGITFWFTLKWSINRNKNGTENFWADQKDEIMVTALGGLVFLVFDDEILMMYYDLFNKDGAAELKPYYYLLVAPAIERLYYLYSKMHK